MGDKTFKIVQMVPALGWGGAQVFCIQMCNALANYPGYEVTLVSMYHHKPDRHLPLDMLDKRVKFVTLGKKRGPDPRIFGRIYRLLKDIAPDVVHTHLHSGYYCFYAYRKLKELTFRKIHTFHNLVKMDAPWYGRKAYQYFFGKGIIQAVSISDEVHKSALEEYKGCPIVQINNGSDPVKPSAQFAAAAAAIAALKPTPATKVLINVARISKQKNQQLLQDCLKTLEAEKQDVIAIILGECAVGDEKIYENLLASKPGNVHFLGKVPNVSDYLLNSDAFVLTSIFEGLPISLLEALSAGVVPVCTPVGGLINIVKPNIGFLSADVSYEAYLAALKAWLQDDEVHLKQLQENGMALYDALFSMNTCAAAYNKLYIA